MSDNVQVLGPKSTTVVTNLSTRRINTTAVAPHRSPTTNPMSTTPHSLSNDASTSSSSPPEPVTPPRQSRSRTRYPDLGRVPLHRRGNSRTYERLEDLLKEAGYKETRVFTPEAERMGKGGDDADEEGDGSKALRYTMKEGVGAVVGFLAGLMPTGGSKVESNTTTTTNVDGDVHGSAGYGVSPPPSPLAEASARRLNAQAHVTVPNSALSSSLESLGNATPRTHTTQSRQQQPSWDSTFMPPPPPIPSSSSHSTRYRPSSQWSASQYSLATTIQKQTSRHSLNRRYDPLNQRHDPQNQRPDPQTQHPNQPHPQISSPRPSRAGALLRHISSVPSMTRPNSTPVHGVRVDDVGCVDELDGNGHDGEGLGYGAGEVVPPLPSTWLESVARAVLFGGTGAHVGGPSDGNQNQNRDSSSMAGKSSTTRYATTTNRTATTATRPATGTNRTGAAKTPALRTTRSSLSQTSHYVRGGARDGGGRSRSYQRGVRSGLSDQTNTGGTSNNANANAFLVPPPLLFTMLERGRAGKSEGEVSHMRVMCRSAPGSRTGSLVRGVGDDYGKEKGRRREVTTVKKTTKKKKKKEDGDRMPCLARTHAEGEVWERGRAIRRPSLGSVQSPPRSQMQGASHVLDTDDNDDEDDNANGSHSSSSSSDEGEIDLARILVPPKRQNSIRSLRKHLDPGRGLKSYSTLLNLNLNFNQQQQQQQGLGVVGVRSGALGVRRPMSVAGQGRRGMMDDVEEGSGGGARRGDWDEEFRDEFGSGWVKRGGVGRGGLGGDRDEDEDDESYIGFLREDKGWNGNGSGRWKGGSGTGRAGLTNGWGLLGGGSGS